MPGTPRLCKPVTHLESTLARNPISVAFKRLTGNPTLLESTLMKNRGEGPDALRPTLI
jgi:hypothetical protein